MLIMHNNLCGPPSTKPKYLMKKDKAYTEDDLLIFNIFFKSIKMTKKEVRDYFKYFGEIKSVYLLCSTNKTRGFVNFADASSATKALQTLDGSQKRHPVYIEAADSWYQPNGSKQCMSDDCNTSTNPSCSADDKQLNILLLPDYCLEVICGNLKLSEQISFARLCPRLHEVFQMYCKQAYRSFDCEVMKSLTKFEKTYFLRYVGVHIKTLRIGLVYIPKITEKMISIFCVNVKCLTILGILFPRCRLKILLRNLKNVQELQLAYGGGPHGFEVLLEAPNLQIICIPSISSTGEMEIIRNMPQLVGLHVYCCHQLRISHWVDILKSLKKLKLLAIVHAFWPNNYLRVLNAISDYGTELVVLKIDYYSSISYTRLTQMPNLKRLLLYYTSVTSSDCTQLLTLLENLVVYKSSQMEELKIPPIYNLAEECFEAISQLKELKRLDLNDCETVNDDALRKFCILKKLQKISVDSPYITNKGVLELMNNCNNLRYVNMQKCCKIDTHFITEAIKILEERRGTLRKPMELYVCGTSISKTALADMPDYKAAAGAGLMKVDCEHKIYGSGFQNDSDAV